MAVARRADSIINWRFGGRAEPKRGVLQKHSVILLSALILSILTLGATGTPASATIDGTHSANLGPKLLAVSQTPTGWSVTSGGAESGCLAQIPSTAGLKKTASADVQFTIPGANANNFEEKLVTFSGSAQRAYTRVVSGFTSCKHVNAKYENVRWSGSFGQMSFPNYGSRSEAFNARFKSSRASFSYVVVVAELGNIIMVTSESYGGQPDLAQFESYVTAAIAKVHGTSTNLTSTSSPQPSTTTTTTSPPPATTTTTEPPPPPPTTTPTTTPGQNTAASAPPGIAGPVPNVVGENLSPAEATLLGDNLGYQTESSGVFGVIVASDWTVCSQTPTPGTVAASVTLVVARSCS